MYYLTIIDNQNYTWLLTQLYINWMIQKVISSNRPNSIKSRQNHKSVSEINFMLINHNVISAKNNNT